MATDTQSAHELSAATPAGTAHADPLAVRANKLDLLERLADDLAHEIKNPLHSMVINLEVLKRRVARATGDQDDLQKYIGVLGGELERVTRRIELLLRLSRPGRGPENTTLDEMVGELMEIIQLEARHHDMAVDFRPGLPPARVFVSREAARQVILNLVLGALDAASPGGTLSISVENGGAASRLCIAGPGAPEGAAGGREPGVARALAAALGGRVDGDGPADVVFSLPVAGS